MTTANSARTSAGGPLSSYPPQPASPTLTNPDMILPDYDDGASSPGRAESPLRMWHGAQSADLQFDFSPQAFAGPVTPTTPIIYGNGTMLSDIGEVTEVESTCAPSGPRSSLSREQIALRSSSTVPYNAMKTKQRVSTRERRMSIESNSTITTVTNDHTAGAFADFDDSVSVEDASFQGDDEESVADSYIDEGAQTPVNEKSAGLAQELYSTELSRRAEQILANAKRRLTTMEGNLSRARTSLYSPSPYSVGSGSTPSPTFNRPATAVQPSGHSRIASDLNIPTETKHQLTSPRSSSALGAAGGYRQNYQRSRPSDSSRNGARGHAIWGDAGSSRNQMSLHGHAREHSLEPLSEDGIYDARDDPSHRSLEGAKLDSFLSPTFGSFSEQGLKRSASTAQMRDLKDQMKDLKGRLSTLRDQARADSMKRRSLQSLRTPSPFTHARVDQWYVDPKAGYDDTVSVPSEVSLGSPKTDPSSVGIDGRRISTSNRSIPDELEPPLPTTSFAEADVPDLQAETETQDPQSIPQYFIRDGEPDDDMKTEDGYDEGEAEEVYDDAFSESGESLYHDAYQHPVSHEDREDAFDYEHFFLHSAMGRLGSRNSRNSFSSDDSTETTRAPAMPESKRSSVNTLNRRGSTGSISTMESFATATEGRTTRAGTAVGYWEDPQSPPPINMSAAMAGIATSRNSESETTEISRRATFGGGSASVAGASNPVTKVTVINRSQSSAAGSLHRPSISSMSSSGTSRSFPLVNRPKTNNGSRSGSSGILTPNSSSPDFIQENKELEQSEEEADGKRVGQRSQHRQRYSQQAYHSPPTEFDDTASICESIMQSQSGTPIQDLENTDQMLVQQVVATLGKCVLALSEQPDRTSLESQRIRARIQMAKRVLEGIEDSPQ